MQNNKSKYFGLVKRTKNRYHIFTIILVILSLIVCFPAHSQNEILSNKETNGKEKITWPSKFEPSNSPIFVHNEIEINASPSEVWFWLTNAITWHEWYFNASNVEIHNSSDDSHLGFGTKFRWKSFGINMESEVVVESNFLCKFFQRGQIISAQWC